jgi:DNA-binding transcriptional regulator GbsR (MarR family)
MTEITEKTEGLRPAARRFVLHWGEMGAVWGVNRSVGQVHALLYLSEAPMTAEAISAQLALARSNVSTALKELLGWGLVRRVHVMGDRRDFFAAEADVWEMVTRIAEGRKTREIDPTLDMLRACAAEAEADRQLSATSRRRIAELRDFVEMLDRWSAELRRMPKAKLTALMRLGGAVLRLLPKGTRAGNDAEPPAERTPRRRERT